VTLVPTGIVTVCCDTHLPRGCCDPNDCGPCCADCPTCPTVARWRAEGWNPGLSPDAARSRPAPEENP
jgi:hypothetical protein